MGPNLKSLLSQESVDELTDCAVGLDNSIVCAICLADVCGNGPAVLLPCQHCFHRPCVTKWLTECEDTCPVCKQPAHSSFLPYEQITIQAVRPCAKPRFINRGTIQECYAVARA